MSAAVEIRYWRREDALVDGRRREDLADLEPLAVTVRPATFVLFHVLQDLAFEVARRRPELQGATLPVEVHWNGGESAPLPVLSAGGVERAYPQQALRGAEVVPDAASGTDVLYVATPSAHEDIEEESWALTPVDASTAAPVGLVVEVPSFQEGPAIALPTTVLGAEHALAGAVPVVLPWPAMKRWATDVARRLREGEPFTEEAQLGVGVVMRAGKDGVVNVVVDLLPARHATGSAASLVLPPATYDHHRALLAELATQLAPDHPALSLSVWAHDHHLPAIMGASREDDDTHEVPADDSPATSGLFFSQYDVAVHRQSYSQWAVGLVLDAAAAETLDEITIADADRLFAVFGWWRGLIVRRSALLATTTP